VVECYNSPKLKRGIVFRAVIAEFSSVVFGAFLIRHVLQRILELAHFAALCYKLETYELVVSECFGD